MTRTVLTAGNSATTVRRLVGHNATPTASDQPRGRDERPWWQPRRHRILKSMRSRPGRDPRRRGSPPWTI